MNKLLSVTIGGVALILSTGLQASGNVSTQSQSQQLIKDFRSNSYAVRYTFGSVKNKAAQNNRSTSKLWLNQKPQAAPDGGGIIRTND